MKYNGLTGKIITRHDLDYHKSRTNINASIPLYPRIIIFCQNKIDVQNAYRWAVRRSIPFRIRSRRHHFENYSLINDGIIIDVSEMNKIHVNGEKSIAKIEAGAKLGDVYDTLWKYRKTIPAGTSADIGITGLTLGGGIGYLTRFYGLTCDQLLEVECINATGHIIKASNKSNRDLFWALHGGGGGNFGIVTSLTYQLHAINKVNLFTIEWDWSDFQSALIAWQKWAIHADNELTTSIKMKANKTIIAEGIYLGNLENMKKLIYSLRNECKPQKFQIKETTFIHAFRYFNNPNENLPSSFKRSGSFIEKILSFEAVSKVKQLLEQAPNEQTFFKLQSLGGKMAEIQPKETAFYYRKALMVQEYRTDWTKQEEGWKGFRWIENVRQTLSNYTFGEYVNFPDRSIPNWGKGYYAENYPRLRQIKNDFDPTNRFHFQQSIH